MFQGFYINMDRDKERRSSLELNLEQVGLADKYSRFPAIDGKTITYGPDALPGTAVLGCLLSHLSIIKNQLHTGKHLHIIEDDAILHEDIGRMLEAFATHQQMQDWDILMTDIFLPPDVYLFKYLHQKFKETTSTGSISFLDIGDWEFAGATSYFVNAASKEKILQSVEHGFQAEIPYDIRLKNLAKSRQLKIYVCLPFYSTLSDACSNSTFGSSTDINQPLFEYRRSFYIDSDLEDINRKLMMDESSTLDIHTQIYLNLIKTLINPRYVAF